MCSYVTIIQLGSLYLCNVFEIRRWEILKLVLQIIVSVWSP